ncbi:MAG: hypothetical protein ACKVHR_08530 [Pirellulales bacterium]
MKYASAKNASKPRRLKFRYPHFCTLHVPTLNCHKQEKLEHQKTRDFEVIVIQSNVCVKFLEDLIHLLKLPLKSRRYL